MKLYIENLWQQFCKHYEQAYTTRIQLNFRFLWCYSKETLTHSLPEFHLEYRHVLNSSAIYFFLIFLFISVNFLQSISQWYVFLLKKARKSVEFKNITPNSIIGKIHYWKVLWILKLITIWCKSKDQMWVCKKKRHHIDEKST